MAAETGDAMVAALMGKQSCVDGDPLGDEGGRLGG